MKAWQLRKAAEASLGRLALRANYRLGNYRETVWLIGSARSGTTWVSSLLNYDKRYREMFEPFHPTAVNRMHFLLPHQYLRPGELAPGFEEAATEVFTGALIDRWVDVGPARLIYRGLLVKDIFANLFAGWAAKQFPRVRIILLIRNPFAVALSLSRSRGWCWFDDPMALLGQEKLREDYLCSFEDIIREVSDHGDFISRQILIWCILNYVPLRQFTSADIQVCFYEDFFSDPVGSVSRLAGSFPGRTGMDCPEVDMQLVKQPSRTATPESAFRNTESPVYAWESGLSVNQIDHGMKILECFGLDRIYGRNPLPDRDALGETFL